ncbi:hypothetical protein [Streptomyces pristinaespiralis]|uniref:hypothetical protein n=1 Tax=Streptomyces pristinaespiralis TaxID=38300 RepID=UPI0033FCC359
MRLSDVLTEDEVDIEGLEAPANPPGPGAARAALERADEDLLVDVGRGRAVQVFKGDAIPQKLAGLPRRPMHASPGRRPGKAKTSRRRGAV